MNSGAEAEFHRTDSAPKAPSSLTHASAVSQTAPDGANTTPKADLLPTSHPNNPVNNQYVSYEHDIASPMSATSTTVHPGTPPGSTNTSTTTSNSPHTDTTTPTTKCNHPDSARAEDLLSTLVTNTDMSNQPANPWITSERRRRPSPNAESSPDFKTYKKQNESNNIDPGQSQPLAPAQSSRFSPLVSQDT
ncbi:mucin-2-like [Sycon ciliatum]|uniref:mucin-2-like n=1 Tax=Sycon ciliatum TaxID=27933 RepID=UPI0031F6E896